MKTKTTIKKTRRRTFLTRIIDAAYRHGWNSEPEMEVGDLQTLAYDLWDLLTPAQRTAFAGQDTWREFVKEGQS